MASAEILRRYDGIRIPLGGGREALDRVVRTLVGASHAAGYRIVRQSVDARDRSRIFMVYAVETGPLPPMQGLSTRIVTLGSLSASRASAAGRPVIVGTGPAGMFAGLVLARAGLRPILLEQGKEVGARAADVARFWSGGGLDERSNVQFGEGGAGTFSDGKLTTGIHDVRVAEVFQELVLAGAPEEILYLARPHIGTDRLPDVVCGIRRCIESLGGEYRFGCRFTGARLREGAVRAASYERLSEQVCGESPAVVTADEIDTSHVILAIGHSARMTYPVLLDMGLDMSPKPFSIGIRIEHPQVWIDRAQYGVSAGHPELPPAEYKLSCHLASGRSAYTFCMCPGGRVVAAASEHGRLVTNGMSAYARDGANANSAVLVSVQPADFPDPSPLGGIAFQAGIEAAAFRAAGSGDRAPAQSVGDFLSLPRSLKAGDGGFSVVPTYRPGTSPVPLEEFMPGFATSSLREALPIFDRKLRGFAHPDAILTGPETRSSSPVRILRDEAGRASVAGFYPCGEGAGYAGGIVSAAVDGVRAAEALIRAVITG